MTKHNKVILIICVALIVFAGCEKNNKLDKDYYGNELYNASYGYIENDATLHIIPLMSKEDITKVTDVQVESEGGTYYLDYSIEDGEFDYKNYHLYRICLKFSNVKFEEDSINVSSINLFYDNGKQIYLPLDQCEIKKIHGEYNNEFIDINGSPLKTPSDMLSLPLELSSDSKIEITNIYLTNKNMKLLNFVDNNGNRTDTFKQFSLSNNGNIAYWSADFTIGDIGIDSYKSYCTTMVIEYICEGKKYYVVPAVPRTIYNPFDSGYDGIEKYFMHLEDK